MKKNFFLQIILGVIISLFYFITLYFNNYLNNYCFNFDDCKFIIIFNFFKLLFLFAGVNLIWLFGKFYWKTIMLLLANILLFFFFIIDSEAFFSTPFILSLILFHLFYVNKFEKNIYLLIIENLLLFILINLLFLSVDELLLGIPFSQKELHESSNFFQNYLLGSALFIIILTLLVYFLRFKNRFTDY